jgi:hypothetical protein
MLPSPPAIPPLPFTLTVTVPWLLLSTACRWLRLPHQMYGTELKNVMERFIQHIKDRTECFDDHFPCRKQDCDRQHIRNWL